MKTLHDIFITLKDQYFWDTDRTVMDPEHSKQFIVERVFSLGDIADMRSVIQYYGKEQVVEVLCNLNYLDPKTLNFISKLFNVPKKNFRCHKRKQSTTQLWAS